MRLLRVVAGGHAFTVPLDRVLEARPAPPKGALAIGLAAALGLEPSGTSILLRLRADHGRDVWLAVDAVGTTVDAEWLPMPDLRGSGGERLPYAGLALHEDGQTLVLDLAALEGVGPPSRNSSGAVSQAAVGGALLVCSLGSVTLRRRPLLLGLPMATLGSVGPVPLIVPCPALAAPALGLAVVDSTVVPVVSGATLAGLPAPGEVEQRQAVLARTPAGPTAVLIDAALGTEPASHWAPPALLQPLTSPALAGVLPRPERWVAVVDPGRIRFDGAWAVPPAGTVAFGCAKDVRITSCQAQPPARPSSFNWV